MNRNQYGPYIDHHVVDYLRLLNNIKSTEHQFDKVKINDIFFDENTKITNSLFYETQILDPVLHKVKMWKTHITKTNSVTPEIRGNKGLFAYYRKFKSVIIDENTSLMTMLITLTKKSLIRVCLPLILILCTFFENHCTDTVGHTGLEKMKRIMMQKYYFPNLHTWIKILLADCSKWQTDKIFANNHNKANAENLASTKTYFIEMIMIDTNGPINLPFDGNQYIFVIVDAFSHFVTIICAPRHTAHYALHIHCII